MIKGKDVKTLNFCFEIMDKEDLFNSYLHDACQIMINSLLLEVKKDKSYVIYCSLRDISDEL